MNLRLTIALSAAWLAAGCQSSQVPSAGMASVRVKVVAQPKAGAPAPPQRLLTYDTPAPRNYGAFARVNYADLGQIVVWLEPVAPATPAPAAAIPAPLNILVNAREPDNQVSHVASVGQMLLLRNAGGRSAAIYCVSDGNEFDFEHVSPGEGRAYTIKSPGLIEVLLDGAADPVAQIYAAPTQWVRLARARDVVEFDNLPPGQYRVLSWHPRLPGSETYMKLNAGQILRTEVKVGVNALPKVKP